MRCAYVTFVIRNDSYIPGALVLGYALKMHSRLDRVCLVTNEVSPAAQQRLRVLYDYVISVSEIHVGNVLKGGRQDSRSLPSRFNALRLGPDGDLGLSYDKIVLLDADVLPLGPYDELFALPAPAGIVMEGKSSYLQTDGDGNLLREADASGRWLWHRRYEPLCAHGEPVPDYITRRILYDHQNRGVNSGLWLLEPSMREFDALMAYLEEPEIRALVTGRFPWPEMQLGTAFWSGRWTSVDARYCSIGGYPALGALYGTHFAGLKPWQIKNASIRHYAGYPDFALWYQLFCAMYWSCPELRESPKLRRIWEFARAKRG